jgi:hypothetical protein
MGTAQSGDRSADSEVAKMYTLTNGTQIPEDELQYLLNRIFEVPRMKRQEKIDYFEDLLHAIDLIFHPLTLGGN